MLNDLEGQLKVIQDEKQQMDEDTQESYRRKKGRRSLAPSSVEMAKILRNKKQKEVDIKHTVAEGILKEKIKLVRKQLAEFQDNPEEHSIEEMLIMNRKRKDFDNLNFLTGDAVKNFKSENQKVASFL